MLADFITMLDEARNEIGEDVVLSLEVTGKVIRFRVTSLSDDGELQECGVGVRKSTLYSTKSDVMAGVINWLRRKMNYKPVALDDDLEIPLVKTMEFVDGKRVV